jgi:parallel beta-helix repeat protein
MKEIVKKYIKGGGLILLTIISVLLIGFGVNYWSNYFDNSYMYFIRIDGNGELHSFCSIGSGTQEDPYVIENLIAPQGTWYGIAITNTDKFLIIRNCTISYQKEFGIYLWGCDNIFIENNSLVGNIYGIYYSNCNKIVISTNSFIECYDGVLQWESNYCTLSKNIIHNCEVGVYASSRGNSDFNNYVNNDCTNNTVGLSIGGSHNNLLNNTCSYNDKGITITGGLNNTVSYNLCRYNRESGIELLGGNQIISNNQMVGCGFRTYAIDTPIDMTNKVNGKSVHHYNNKDGLNLTGIVDVGQIILVNCNYCKISSLNLSNASIGIYLEESSHNLIINNTCSNEWIGIICSGGYPSSENNTISNNTCSFNRYCGITLGNRADNNYIHNNSLNNNYEGISISNSFSNIVTENQFINCGISVSISYVNNPPSNSVIDTSNKINGKSLRYYEFMNGLVISGLTDVGQLYLKDCTNFKIEDLNIANTSCAVLLKNSSYNIIKRVNCSENRIGLYLSTSYYNTISDCILSNNSEYGIYYYMANNNNFTRNIVSLNEIHGVYGVSAEKNIFWNNLFLCNIKSNFNSTPGALDNLWDNGSVGNYWSDYTSRYPFAQINLDGISWDTPYVIYDFRDEDREDIMDHYPMVNPVIQNG